MQTAEAIRRDGQPRWFILTGLIHDLGKILCLFGEPQWAVVGDTFPVGCAYSDKVVFPEFFADNPDAAVPDVSDAVWRLRGRLRARSCPPVLGPRRIPVPRRQGASAGAGTVHDPLPFLLCGPQGRRVQALDERAATATMFAAVRAFNPYDLYSKGEPKPDVRQLKPYYQDLIAEFFPSEQRW